MKFLRDNFAYLLLAVIALVLILVTLSLQVAIFSTAAPGETQGNRGLLYTLRQQLAALIQPATDTPVTSTTATVGQPTATTIVLPTTTPNVILLQPSPLPPTPTPTTVVPTTVAPATVAPTTATDDSATATLLPGAYNVNAVATRLAAPTVTSAQRVAPPAVQTPVPTATTILSPTNVVLSSTTPGVAVDFRIGYVASNPTCAAVTNLMKIILEHEFNLQIATVAFADPGALYEKLATKAEGERVDLTFCYTDPADRQYLQKYFGFMIFIGSSYRQFNNQKFIIMSNAAVKSPIERGNPCLYRFLTSLNLNDVELSADMAAWYQSHTEEVAGWARCK